MPVKNAKKQDYLTVEGHAARLRQDATFTVSYLSTATVVQVRHLTTDAVRLDGLKVTGDATMAAGSCALIVQRLRDGVVTQLAAVTLDATNVVADTAADISAGIDQSKSVRAGDTIRFSSTPTVPTSLNLGVTMQFAGNGPK